MLAAALVGAAALSGCGGSSDDGESAPAATATAEQPAASEAATAAAGGDAQAWSASLTWPAGSNEFSLNICTSIGEHTIQAGGDTTDGAYNLVLDANLLESGDTGTLTVSQKSDMTVVYDADVTELTVQSDGSFSGSGQDAGQAPFTITGTCLVTW